MYGRCITPDAHKRKNRERGVKLMAWVFQPPQLFRRKDGRSFAFAGILTNGKVEDEWMSTYAIRTMEANELSAPIHNRMPVVFDQLAYDAGL